MTLNNWASSHRSILATLTCSWCFASTVADWHADHTPASGVRLSARPQTVTPAEKINISPHRRDETRDNDAAGTMATAVIDTHLWCQEGGFIYFADVFSSSSSSSVGLLLLSLTDTVLWKINGQNHNWCITYDTGLVPEERHERGRIRNNMKYCREWEGWVKHWIRLVASLWRQQIQTQKQRIMCILCQKILAAVFLPARPCKDHGCTVYPVQC